MSISVKYPIIGAKVVRGKDWDYGNQDGGEGKTGVIIENLENDWVRVKWENDCKDNYRIGCYGMYDLYFATEKDALLQEAMERFPSGCSYANISTYDIYINVEYDYPFWYGDNQIALKYKKGLIYDNGKWAERTDVPVKEERVEVFPGIYIGDTVVSLIDVGIARKIGDIFRVLPYSKKNDLYYKKVTSSFDKESWRLATPEEIKFYNNGGKNINYISKKEYAAIINKPINTNQNGEKSKSNPSSNGSTNTTNVECSTKRENGIKVQRPYIKIPTTVRSGGAGLKSSDSKVRFGSNSSYNQKRLSIS